MPWKDNVYVPCWTMDDTDVWNFDTVLASFISEGLTRMRRIGHGYPGYSNEESWDWQLEHHAQQFAAYAEDDEIDITESWLWLAYNHAALWDQMGTRITDGGTIYVDHHVSRPARDLGLLSQTSPWSGPRGPKYRSPPEVDIPCVNCGKPMYALQYDGEETNWYHRPTLSRYCNSDNARGIYGAPTSVTAETVVKGLLEINRYAQLSQAEAEAKANEKQTITS